MMHSWAT